MARLALLTAGVLVASVATGPAQSLDTSALRAALEAALAPALPYPPARADGTPERGGPEVVWAVNWAEADEPHVEVLANPLNEENRQRALAAEQAIQKAAMQSQRQSQADYERALTDFQRTGRTSEIREITLRDDGVAGERYDAESQLTVSAEIIEEPRAFAVASGTPPEVGPDVAGATAVVRVRANSYTEEGPGMAETLRYCPEQAWVVIGGLTATVRREPEGQAFAVSVSSAEGPGGRGAVIWIRGNPGLVEQVLSRADWPGLRARFGG